VLSFGYFFALMAGLLLMLLQLRFGIPPAVTDSPRLRSSGMAVLPLPSMIIHPGPPIGLFAVRPAVFIHTGWSHGPGQGRPN
jgi:hypothetical protein